MCVHSFRKYGPNGIPEKKVPLIKLLFDHYINNPMQYMILAAAVLSGATKDFTGECVCVCLDSLGGGVSPPAGKTLTDLLVLVVVVFATLSTTIGTMSRSDNVIKDVLIGWDNAARLI